MSLISVYYRHNFHANVPITFSFNGTLENIINGMIIHHHHNHGTLHGGIGNPGFAPPCNCYFDNVFRFSSLPHGSTYTEYVVSTDPFIAGAYRLIISSGQYIVEQNQIVSPICYFTDDHYNTYYKLFIYQPIIQTFNDDGTSVSTTTGLYGSTHMIFHDPD
ncbi:hypothetical protein I5445_07780 [Citrobacter farmeri]|uniref:ribonuclease domain-containing protein n=1 Tax=Citrobacter farmeri TaxID=67824 RepID=UPI001904409F|nr:ribonuclease domain-containing protein [Citrobacter farmeri]EKV7297559.1 hypothetical protein [Citrobacter farmeri]MBJ8744269.1 hypothetical protein [Citrobacter farmeri]MBJ8757916.1 hypothetical protein [Citrobacter farmeri]MBJ9017819.1 hypothetical protein [Citrobacter farmeri]